MSIKIASYRTSYRQGLIFSVSFILQTNRKIRMVLSSQETTLDKTVSVFFSISFNPRDMTRSTIAFGKFRHLGTFVHHRLPMRTMIRNPSKAQQCNKHDECNPAAIKTDAYIKDTQYNYFPAKVGD